MESISPNELAFELLHHCLRGNDPPGDLLETLLRCALHPDPERAREGSRALFSIVVERLGDLFEPALCDTYARLFAAALEYVLPELRAQDLLDRYRRVRQVRRFAGKAPKNVYVLSRVTLGADVAITSQALDAAKRAFPHAAIWFVGPPKNWEMFAADPRLRHIPVAYGRDGLLQARLAVWPALRDALAQPGVVIDPDSRLTQLGLLPVCEEENYYFFESRAYGEYGQESLVALTRRWLGDTFGVPDSRPYIAPSAQGPAAEITVSFGAGDNPAKRVADPFELELLRVAASRGRVLLDEGAGGEETERAQRYAQELGVEAWRGAFAPFAAAIASSRLYIGYDSAGQHVAAACGTPLVSVFGGFACERMFARWRPEGRGPIEVVRASDADSGQVLSAAAAAVERLVGAL